MSERLDDVFDQFEDVFVARKEEIKDYLLKYKKDTFKKRDVIKIERIDVTDRLKTSGFRKNLSMWQNFYDNIILSSCIEVKGEEKRYDYKFYFTEEKLDSELLEEVENAINEANKLKQRRKYEEALDKVDTVEDTVAEKKDKYIDGQLRELRQDIINAQEKYHETLQEIENLESTVTKEREQQDFGEAISLVNEIIALTESVNDRKLKKKYKNLLEEIKRNQVFNEIEGLDESLNDARSSRNFKSAIEGCNKIIETARSGGLTEKEEKYNIILEEIKREQTQYEINELKQKAEDNRSTGRYHKAMENHKKIIEIAESNDLEETRGEALKVIKEIEEEINQVENEEEIHKKISSLKKQITEEEEMGNYELALESTTKIIGLAESIGDQEDVEKFFQFREEISKKIEEMQREREKRTILNQINDLESEVEQKKEIRDLEGIIDLSNEIIELGKKIQTDELIAQYQDIIEGTKREIEESRKREALINKILNLDETISKERREGNFEKALNMCSEILNLIESIDDEDLSEKYIQIQKDISQELEAKDKVIKKKAIEKQIKALEKEVEQKQNAEDSKGIIEISNKIVELTTEIGREDLAQKYQGLIEQTQRDLEEKREEKKAETVKDESLSKFRNEIDNRTQKKENEEQELFEQAKKFEDMVEIEEDILPLVEEFSTDELIGDISDDVDQVIEQLNSLLETHRVEVKEAVKSTSMLISESGESMTRDDELRVEQVEEEEESTFEVESGFQNPFDEMIEDAIISDLIPYNYEIRDVKLNKEKPKLLPVKTKLKEGLEMRWHLKNIPPEESIKINYNLRKRISRTIIFLLEDQLKILKTHSNLKDSKAEFEGLYNVNFPFSNSYERPLDGLVIEDIIPLYYINEIKKPSSYIPKKDKSMQGNLLKWNIGKLEPKTIDYRYKLLELYRFEELKALIYQLDKEGFSALKQENYDVSRGKYKEILKVLEGYI